MDGLISGGGPLKWDFMVCPFVITVPKDEGTEGGKLLYMIQHVPYGKFVAWYAYKSRLSIRPLFEDESMISPQKTAGRMRLGSCH